MNGELELPWVRAQREQRAAKPAAIDVLESKLTEAERTWLRAALRRMSGDALDRLLALDPDDAVRELRNEMQGAWSPSLTTRDG